MLRLQARHFDMISNLPDAVKDEILMKLPTIDADAARSKVTMILLQLMLNHEGPVLKFTLSIPGFESCSIIDNLILFLSRNNIEDFTLQMWEDHYSLPASIFKCQLLRHLQLEGCSVSNTRELKGFSRLTTLVLIDIIISDEALRSLISESPLLESLELRMTHNLDIYIDAPNLRKFSFEGFARLMSLQLMPLVASVSIKLDHIGTEPCKECSLTQFFQTMPAIEYLYLDYGMIKKFYMKEPKLCTTLVHLQYLDLNLMSFDEMEFQFTLCLLRSFPNLKSVEIEIKFFFLLFTGLRRT
ncbi:hypothetical protein LIER_35266 [Lithospermum erythrorhizon]|uniref:F-box/LRR-repeat protein 15/At3g58940/PEG3-like LRR domain-containing protein n=1 Tax=Lithospermum erythrorhizon TaxID=34254 RepID=A0AAV3NNY8_LITER